MKNLLLILSLFCFLNSSPLYGQFSFTNQNSLLANQTITSGAPMGVQDMNGDFLDDIVRLDNTQNLTIDYQNANGTFTTYVHGQVTSGAWAMPLGDISNDGFNEILVGGIYNGITLVQANGTANYTNTSLTIPMPGIFVQGSSLVDVNNDGWLDAYFCHDDGPNSIFVNDGSGDLSHSGTSIIDFAKFPGPDENNSGNYGVTWTDFDCDGDIDLYIAKCRGGASSPTDSRRINQLWENDGNGNYTETAANYGLDDGSQSWVAEFQDIDNDGDLDVFIGNHDVASKLYRNDNGTYVDISISSGLDQVSGGNLVQVAMKDFDNDGFVDLIASARMYRNNGDNTFTQVASGLGGFHSFGIGDLNHDGALDVYAGYATGYNNPSNVVDKLWLNNDNSNNYLAVNLTGTTSNRGAVGAQVQIIGPWGTMTREVRAGESYGITHSLTQHFGLGSFTTIPQLKIKWPSGLIETYDNLPVNQFMDFTEGGNNCSAFYNLPTVNPGVYNAQQFIQSNATITSGAVTFYAGDYIQLDAGFEVSNGATFLADIQGCTP